MPWWFLAAAFAGYGDAQQGVPTPAERELHLWTNAVRAAPDAFRTDYQRGGCAYDRFQTDEKTPKLLLAWHPNLARVARDHSKDMQEHNQLSHDSSDGTSFAERVEKVYRGITIGENVAVVSPAPYTTVMEGWMCSSGHRSNIMEPSFDELGTGVAGTWMTQDFGARQDRRQSLLMGAHTPWVPTDRVTLLVDHDGSSVDEVVAVLDGDPIPMDLTWGDERRGVYRVSAEVGAGCHVYWFEEPASGDRFPAEGAYGFGDCAFDAELAGWLSAESVQAIVGTSGGGAGGGRGCDQVGRSGAFWALSALSALSAAGLRRRKR
jgi:hypothetical protein